MAKMTPNIPEDLLIHPGETIQDVLVERGITQDELAVRTGVCSEYVRQVVSGKRDITDDFAAKLEDALDIPKTFWMNLQENYNIQCREFKAKL